MIKKKNLSVFAYDTIKQKIMDCEYEPNALIIEDDICKELDISRTPVRDALGRLEQESLVKKYPKKGYIIAPVTISEINMVYEGRLLLEPYIIRNYCQHLSDETINEMITILKKEKAGLITDSNDLYNLDDQFHMVIVNQCTNHYLISLYKELNVQNRRLRVLGGRHEKKRTETTIQEHQLIISELQKYNYNEAAEFMQMHIKNSKETSFLSFIKS